MLAAGCCISLLFLLAPTLFCAGETTTTPPLTVLMDFESPHSEASLQSLRQSLNQILNPGGIDVDVQIKADLPQNPQFGELVIFKMKGSCSMNALPVPDPPVPYLIDERGPLGMAYTSDGQVLHFGEVECDRVRRVLQRILGYKATPRNQQTYGLALAIVIAHEVYHMLGNVRNHTHEGLTKPALTASELTNTKLALPRAALDLIERTLHPAVTPNIYQKKY
jgi:hypothetical protein